MRAPIAQGLVVDDWEDPDHPGLLGFLPRHEHIDLTEVGPEDLERHQDALGGDAPDATSFGIFEGVVGPIFEVAIHPLDGAAEGAVGGMPLGTLVEQFLSVLRPASGGTVIDCWAQIFGGNPDRSLTGMVTRPRVEAILEPGLSSHRATGLGLDAGHRMRR